MPEAEEPIDPAWVKEFEASLRRTLRDRLDYSFIRTHQPVMDDEPWRAFASMDDYRRWCRESLPWWLGYA